MAEREASIKLTLDGQDYVANLRKAGDETEAFGKKGAKSAGLFGKGLKEAASQTKALGGHVSKVVGLVTGLAGGMSLASGLQGAVKLQSQYKTLAFRISQATGETMKSADVQAIAERAAAKAGRRTVEMADAFGELFAATGDATFATDVLGSLGTTATGTGESMDSLVTLADQLHTKFGVAASEMEDTFAQVFASAQKGGPAFGEFAAVMSTVGAELTQAGMGGKRGLDFMLGALVKTDDEMKNIGAQVKGVKQILLSLGDDAQIKALSKTLAINPNVLLNEKDMMARMRKVLGMGKKGLDALKGSMKEAEEQKALRILFTDPFEKALADANASGAKGKAAIDQALGTFDAGIAEFGKSTLKGADIQKQAVERMKDPEARLTAALDQLERSFAQPEIIDAIGELSQSLPDIAKIFASFAKFIAKNPLLAAGLGIAGTAAKGFLQGAGTELIAGHIKGASAAAMRIEAAHVAGGMKAGNLLKGAGALAALAIAGAMAKEQIDKSFAANTEAQGSTAVALAKSGSNRGGIEAKRSQAEDLRRAIEKEKDAGSGASGFTQDLMGGIATLTGSDAPNLRAQSDSRIQELQGLLAKKEREIASLQGGDKTGSAGPGGKTAGTVGIDAAGQRGVGKGVADALKGQVLRVELVNPPGAPGRAGPGGSRGPVRPANAGPGGGY